MNTENKNEAKDITKMSPEEIKKYLADLEVSEREEREKKRQDYEKLRAQTIVNLCAGAQLLSAHLREFKLKAFADLGALFELLKEYSSRAKDGKGNFTIETADFRINFKRQGKASFDERSQQAEQHIKEFAAKRYSEDTETHDLLMTLLERKNDELDVNQVQKLYSMEQRFDDPNWKEGIRLLKESYQYNHSKDYVQFFEKQSDGSWKNINLSFSSL